eukprot:15467506-Alexandrium_andersonii.AAC.1
MGSEGEAKGSEIKTKGAKNGAKRGKKDSEAKGSEGKTMGGELWSGVHAKSGAKLKLRIRCDRPTSTSDGVLVALFENGKQVCSIRRDMFAGGKTDEIMMAVATAFQSGTVEKDHLGWAL